MTTNAWSRQRELGQYMTPPALALQMCEQVRRLPDTWRVLDPACGDGNLLLAAAERMLAAAIPNVHRYLMGIDIDSQMVAKARLRLSELLGCSQEEIQIYQADFLSERLVDLWGPSPILQFEPNIVLSNPPYGRNREYEFFSKCCQELPTGTELVFLIPLAFVDRITTISSVVIDGRPMGVTTGHAITYHLAGKSYTLRRIKEAQSNSSPFSVLSGIKQYELGAGTPPQTDDVVNTKPYSSETPIEGWLSCYRTGDIHPFTTSPGRLWVNYGPHLAHPKEIARFVGPRLFVRRVPIWSTRQLGAVFVENIALCAGDVLVVRHTTDDASLLKGLCVYLNSEAAAQAIIGNRPSILHRTSFPKISAKDLNLLFEASLPSEADLHALSQEYPVGPPRGSLV